MTESDDYETAYVTPSIRTRHKALRERLTPDQAAAAWDRWMAGTTVASIARHFKCTHQAVHHALESVRDSIGDEGDAA